MTAPDASDPTRGKLIALAPVGLGILLWGVFNPAWEMTAVLAMAVGIGLTAVGVPPLVDAFKEIRRRDSR